ncbi:MAG TPA: T9SS type A sorting domain-containing protein [Candidatus Ozemobacteraceae bacterium]|nr:T9SS type A sorting domain-containing protein [Candidatus Ozemobacteraceae bacterium]
MRQTNRSTHPAHSLKGSRAAVALLLLVLAGVGTLFADVDGVTLTVDTDPAYASGMIFNGGAKITLKAAWTKGDTPPFGATFNTGGSAIGTVNTSDKQAQFITTGASLGAGDKDFSVSVIETSVPNAVSKQANGNRTVSINTEAPAITVTLENGSTFSNQAPNNVVNFTVRSSNKDIAGTPDVTVSPSAGTALAPDGTPTAREAKYKLTLSSATTGQYTIRAVCKDTTQPAESANTGSGQNAFNVINEGPSAAAISKVLPQSPTHLSSVTLEGTLSSTMKTVAIYEGGAKVADATVNTTALTWSATLTGLTEGAHKYVARGKDALGNESAGSSEFEVIIDQTKPAAPVLNQPKSPTSNPVITITGTGAIDGGTIKSTPITVMLYDMTGQIASTTANADGTFTFANVTLANEGDNILYARCEDNAKGSPGNLSDTSASIRVVLDTNSTGGTQVSSVVIAQGTALASTSVPFPATTYLGTGDYSVQVLFAENMDRTVIPNIAVKPQNGGETISNSGSWVASNTFVGKISIPSGQGATWDGQAGLRIFGAKDAAGNLQDEYNQAGAFNIDTTAPTTTMDSMETLYISSNTTSITLKGVSNDAGSLVGYVEIATAPFDGVPPTSGLRVPIFNGPTVNWSHNWDVSTLAAGKYKLWAYAADQAKPNPNVEAKVNYRTLIVSKGAPTVVRISLDDEIADLPTTSIVSVASDVTKITAVAQDGGTAGLNLAVPPTLLTLVHDATGKNITGNFSNNGADTITFTFPKLTDNGTYTISFQPIDKAGNQAVAVATRSFALDTAGPDNVNFMPGNGIAVNDTYPSIHVDQVWASIDDPKADYGKSTIEVAYNGINVGNQLSNASTTAVIWDLYGSVASAPKDQSGDGRYDVTVVPRDISGNTGASRRSYFYLDTQAPAVTALSNASGSWVGIEHKTLTLTMSDAPADLVKHHGAKTAQDSTWQSGSGTGPNAAASTYTATLDATVAKGVAQSNSLLAITRPAAPAAAEGVATLTMHAELADMVTNLSPNIRTIDFNYFFDYKRPSFTFTKPLAGKKYCKTSLTVEASTADRGTAPNLQIIKAEVTDAAGNWVSMTNAPALPSNPSTGTIVLDISSWTDGTRSVKGHCTDRGNNLSSKSESAESGSDEEVQIVVDRTPPAVPTLILPLNGSATRLRSQRFKWSQSTDADRYLIQIADDSAFNNILNHTSNTYGLSGQVTMTNEATFTAPKDGTYYWRVAAIETCADGWNISAYSTTFHVLVDSVKPKVLSVSPTPSTGNKITTGMVTFTLRFNEKMDTTITPTVTLTSAGGQAMQVEQISFTEDTWTGTTVIPKDNSATYDGNATIAIAGGKDLAGNEMEADSTNMVVINTGPAFEIKIFSNPAHEYEIMIVSRSTEPLQSAPACSVTQGGSAAPVTMNFLKEKYYAGSYRIDPEQAGKAYIDLTGTDLHGMIGKGSVQFTVANLTPDSRISLKTADGLASLDVATGTVAKAAGLYMLSRNDLDNGGTRSPLAKILPSLLKNAVANTSSPELVEVLPLEEVGPSSLRLNRRIWYTASVKNLKLNVPADKVHLYRQVNGKWIFVGGALKGEQIVAQLGGLGKLALMADLKPPTLSNVSPSDRTKLEDPQPLLEGTLNDSGAGIDAASFKLLIDGVEQSGAALEADGSFAYQLGRPLPKGDHLIEVTASDKAGNAIRQSVTVTAPGPFGISQLIAYPNPVRGNAVWITYNLEQRPDELLLTIYDVSGQRVDKFDLLDANGGQSSGKIRWDLTNRDGDRVSNGVYIYKLEATKNGKTIKSRGKLAVLR